MALMPLCLLCALATVSAFGSRDDRAPSWRLNSDGTRGTLVGKAPRGERFVFVGRVRFMGNVPHTYIGLREAEGSRTFAVTPPEAERHLTALQGRLVRFTVVLLEKGEGEGSPYLQDGTAYLVSWTVLDT